MKKYVVIKSWVSSYSNPISLKKGELVEIDISRQEDNPNWQDWVWCKSSNNEGWVPVQALKTNSTTPNGLLQATVLVNYTAKELNVTVGQVVVEERELNGWIWAKSPATNDEGWVPIECLQDINSHILQRVAPCGLYCGGCFAFYDGKIKNLSLKLKEALGDFDVYANRFVELLDEPTFLKYPYFKEMLNYFSKSDCCGCRNAKCKLFAACNVRECSARKEIEYCYQCKDFPCTNTGFDEHLFRRFTTNNLRIKEIGIERYYLEVRDVPRY
jgi:hypothetical protein